MNRILPIVIASLSLVLAGAGTASANTPMKIVAEAGSNVFAQDHEDWSANETLRRSLAGTTLGKLAAGTGSFAWKSSVCAGDEVRAEVFVDAYRFSDTAHATVTAHIDLYEGASCATEDLEGQSHFVTTTFKLGEVKTLNLAVCSQEMGSDHSTATLTLRAIAA